MFLVMFEDYFRTFSSHGFSHVTFAGYVRMLVRTLLAARYFPHLIACVLARRLRTSLLERYSFSSSVLRITFEHYSIFVSTLPSLISEPQPVR